MTIKLYTSSAEPNLLDKSDSLTEVASVSGTLRADCSITNPVILFEGSEIKDANYIYISDFNRYYFIEDIVSRGKLWEVKARCDVLMSFKEDIKSCTAIIKRQEKTYTKKIKDDKVVLYQKPFYLHRVNGALTFNYSNNDGYVMAVAGSLGGA